MVSYVMFNKSKNEKNVNGKQSKLKLVKKIKYIIQHFTFSIISYTYSLIEFFTKIFYYLVEGREE